MIQLTPEAKRNIRQRIAKVVMWSPIEQGAVEFADTQTLVEYIVGYLKVT